MRSTQVILLLVLRSQLVLICVLYFIFLCFYIVSASGINWVDTQDGHFEFKRMPFGLKNAPAACARMVQRVLGLICRSYKLTQMIYVFFQMILIRMYNIYYKYFVAILLFCLLLRQNLCLHCFTSDFQCLILIK